MNWNSFKEQPICFSNDDDIANNDDCAYDDGDDDSDDGLSDAIEQGGGGGEGGSGEEQQKVRWTVFCDFAYYFCRCDHIITGIVIIILINDVNIMVLLHNRMMN